MRSCGQDVYSLGSTHWITCVFVSTGLQQIGHTATIHAYKSLSIHSIIPNSSPVFSTVKLHNFTSVIDWLIHGIHSTYSYSHELKKGKI